MSKTVGAISELTASTDTSTSALANAVLQDYGLAQKLLRTQAVLAIHQSTLRSLARKR